MGQHTWFYKDANTLREKVALEQRLNSLTKEHGVIFPPAEVVIEMNAINDKIDQLDKDEKLTRDLFRTGKRNPDGTYYEEDLFTKEDVLKFIRENRETIFYFDREGFDEFWKKYPNGAVRLQ